MARYQLRQFANVGLLRRIDPELLRQLLGRWADYFERRGIWLTTAEGERVELDHERLASVLLTPDETTPVALIDALCLIDEGARPWDFEALLKLASAAPKLRHLTTATNLTKGDLAIRIWMAAPEYLERLQAQRAVGAKRLLNSYQPRERPADGAEFKLKRGRVATLERLLAEEFEGAGKSEVVRVLDVARDDETWFVVRHGANWTRKPAIKDGQSTSVFFRPEVYDLLIYDHVRGELKINAESDSDEDRYRRKAGAVFFGDENHFPRGRSKYTLMPLRDDGPQALVCSDVPGLASVALVELTWEGTTKQRDKRHRAEDVFQHLLDEGEWIPRRRKLLEAVFLVTFDDRSTRRVVVRPPNVLVVSRNEDVKLVERFLHLRGFVLSEEDAREADHAALAGA
jgi:hypothetical protein